MKRIRSIMCVVALVMVLSASFAPVTSFARGITCPCGGNMATIRTQYSAWTYTDKTRACVEKAHGIDAQQKRTKMMDNKCKSCGNMLTTYAYEYRWICQGY